jgi:hypothetical protein
VIVSMLAVLAGASSVPNSAAAQEPNELSMTEKMRRYADLKREGKPDAAILLELGLERVSGGGPSLLSENSDVNMSRPSIFKDSASTDPRELGVYADYDWKNTATTGDGSGSGGNVGGYDGFGIRFSQPIIQVSQEAKIWPGKWSGAQPYPAQPSRHMDVPMWSNSEVGTVYRWQDKTYATNCSGTDYPSCRYYDSELGQINMTIRLVNSGCLQAFTHYFHTWSSVSLSSVTITTSGIEAQFTGGSEHWQAASDGGRYNCG